MMSLIYGRLEAMEKMTVPILEWPGRTRPDILTALSLWTPRHVLAAVMATVGVALIIGLSSVLIPNPIFGRGIPPVWWNYQVWILTSIFSGMLIATYVSTDRSDAGPQRSAIWDWLAEYSPGSPWAVRCATSSHSWHWGIPVP